MRHLKEIQKANQIYLEDKLTELVEKGSIKTFEYKSQIPSCPGDAKNRLIDTLDITFNDVEKLSLSTFCSGVLENTSLVLRDE